MTALEFLWGWPWLPMSIERHGRPSRSELRRWCRAHSVLINGSRVEESQELPHPGLGIWQLVFFPDNPKRQCTMVQEVIRLSSDPPPDDASDGNDGEPGMRQMERELVHRHHEPGSERRRPGIAHRHAAAQEREPRGNREHAH